MALGGSGARFGGLRRRGMLWKSGWRGRAAAPPEPFQAFANFTQAGSPSGEQFYASGSGVTPYQFRFTSGQFYIGAIIDIPAAFPAGTAVGIFGQTTLEGGWLIDMDINYALRFAVYGSDGILRQVTTTLVPGFTYALFCQVFVQAGTGDTVMGLSVNGASVGTVSFPAGVTYGPPVALDNPFCLGMTTPGSGTTTAGTMRIVGNVGGDITAEVNSATITDWDAITKSAGGDVPFLTAAGGSAANQDRYTAASLAIGTAPVVYTSLISTETIEYSNQKAGFPSFDVVEFTAHWP